jgi:hypothetical protein
MADETFIADGGSKAEGEFWADKRKNRKGSTIKAQTEANKRWMDAKTAEIASELPY